MSTRCHASIEHFAVGYDRAAERQPAREGEISGNEDLNIDGSVEEL